MAIIKASQKLKQKSQLKSLDISFGATRTIYSRKPILPISRIIKAAINAMQAVTKIKFTIVLYFFSLTKF